MRIDASVEGSISAAMTAAKVRATMAALKGITEAGNSLKEILREQVLAAGFSDRLAKTWQGKVYRNRGMNPAAFVYSKAPKIIDGYARGATAVATGGRRFMAIPTDNVPRMRQGRALSPAEVQQRLGKLRFVPARSAQGSQIGGKAVGFLVIDNVVSKKTTGRLRRASQRERQLDGTGKARPVQSVVMFVLVRSVKFPKLFDLEATAKSMATTATQLIAEAF